MIPLARNPTLTRNLTTRHGDPRLAISRTVGISFCCLSPAVYVILFSALADENAIRTSEARAIERQKRHRSLF